MLENTVLTNVYQVVDQDTPIEQLVFSVTSSNPGLLPTSAIQLVPSGSSLVVVSPLACATIGQPQIVFLDEVSLCLLPSTVRFLSFY